jgi:hypothetical protein
MRNSFLLLLIPLLFACKEPPRGIAHEAVNEVYPYFTMGKWMYSESMIRAALKTAKVDSNSTISRNVEYLFQYEADTTARWFNDDTDSLITSALLENGMDAFASFESAQNSLRVYTITEGESVKDLVIIQQEGSTYNLYEFVGDIKLSVLFQYGMQNREAFENLIDLNLFTDARVDSTDS